MKIVEIDDVFTNTRTSFTDKFNAKLFHNSAQVLSSFMPFRYRGESKDTSTAFHNEVNALAKEYLGIPIRSLLFALNDKRKAEDINASGTVYQIIPTSDDFHIFYSPNIDDMTKDLYVVTYHMADETYKLLQTPVYQKLIKEDFSTTEINKIMHDIRDTLLWAFDYYDDSSNSGSLDDYFKQCLLEVKKAKVFKKLTIQIMDAIEDSFLRSKAMYQNKAYQYVVSIREVGTNTELRKVNSSTEIMIYDPRGFIII